MWRNHRKDKNIVPRGKLKTSSIRRFLLSPVIILVFAFSLVAFGLFTQTHESFATPAASGTNPVVDKKSLGPSDAARSWLYYNMLSYCVKNNNLRSAANFSVWGNSRIKPDDAQAGLWFDNATGSTTSASGQWFLTTAGSGSATDCSGDNSGWILDAITFWGYKDGIDALCAFGAVRVDESNCVSGGGGDSDFTGNIENGRMISLGTFQEAVKKKVYGGQSPSLSKAQEYIFYRNSFLASCLGGNNQPDTSNATGDKIYMITMISEKGKKLDLFTKYEGVMGQSELVYLYNYSGGDPVSKTCAQMASTINADADAYQKVARDLPNGDKPTPPRSDPGKDSTDNDKSCGSQVTGLGWIMCPIINGLTKLNDAMWNLVSGLLTVNPLSQSDNIYKAWGSIRSIANVVFVIFFLIIIFSQLTGAGITNYGVKKMLPKIIVAAILVNVSFIIVQLAVDLANVIGSSLYGLIVGMAPPITGSWDMLVQMLEQTGTFATGAVIGVTMVGGPMAAFWLLLPIALIGALGILTAVLTLIFRQAVIPVLAILAPLAFVAYLLPNTEPWFKKWRSLLMSMLMLYPMAALVFAGAYFAAAVIISGGGFWNLLIGQIILAVPLFSLPFLARQGGAIQGKVAGALSGIAKRANKPLTDWGKSHADTAAAEYRANNGRRGILGRYSPMRHFSRALTAGRENREARTATAKDEFKSQINNNQVRGAFGRRINGQATDDRATAAKKALGMDAVASGNRVIGANPAVNARHGGMTLNEREYGTNKEKERVEGRRDQGLEDDHRFNIARTQAGNAKTDAKAATDRATGRVETALSTRVAKGNAQAAAKTLAREEAKTDEYITEATTTTSPGGIPVGSPAATIQAAYGAELQQGEFGTRRAQAATQHAADQVNKEYEETIAPPTPPNTPIPTTAEAIEAAGIGGPIAVTSEKASAIAAQDERETAAVGKRTKLIASTYDTSHLPTGAAQELRNSIAAGDEIGARSSVAILATSTGGPGRRGLGTEIERILPGAVDDTTRAIKTAVVAADIKRKDAATAAWALDPANQNLATIRGLPSTYSGLTAEELATQNIDSLRNGVGCGGITHDAAHAALKSTAAKDMDEPRRLLLESV